MSMMVADCPRCGTHSITFELKSAMLIRTEYNWKNYYEAFCVCRHCFRSTVFVLSDKTIDTSKLVERAGLPKIEASVNGLVEIEGIVSLKDRTAKTPPEHLPENIEAAFREGAVCMSVNCHNAAGTMFRLCLDLATRTMLPEGEPNGLNSKVRRDLGLRLPWLFKNGMLPKGLEELSSCVKDDGNDGAHQGTLGEEDAADILDFTYELLERLYTEPRRIELAKERKDARRGRT
jgi:hypothetical protein